MKIPILSGIFSDGNSDYRTSYPINLVPVTKDTGVNDSYLRPAEGIELFASTNGIDRGAIVVRGVCYRVIGTKFCRVDRIGVITELGDVGGAGLVSLCQSFDNIGIASNGNLFLWNLHTLFLQQVTDVDLGVVITVNWLDGYFVTTDGEFIVVTDINDPLSVNPLKYGSSEVSPDPIIALPVLRNTLYAINRYSIEGFQNIGGQFFPFQRIDGAYIQRGCVGTLANCIYDEQIAFLGGGQNEPCAVWLGLNGSTTKISTHEIDLRIQKYPEIILSQVLIETRLERSHHWLYIHLPDETLVYDSQASQVMGAPVWFSLSSSITGVGTYNARNFIFAYDKWICGDPSTNRLGILSLETGGHWGKPVGWEVQTKIIYGDTNGAVFWELELMCLTGNVSPGSNPVVSTQYSNDQGVTWSVPRARIAGRNGVRERRINWLSNGSMNERRIERFTGNSDSHITINALEARIEVLYN